MDVNTNISHILSWRYLDSLDSIRFSARNLELRGGSKATRYEQARMEVATAILMGNGIIVPNNQLIDSFGFLRIASELIKIATSFKNEAKNVFIPFKYANFDYSHEKNLGGGPHLKDPFLLAAYLFNKDGLDGKPFFELSAFPKLKTQRAEWAKALSDHCLVIKQELFSKEDNNEPALAEDLLRILNFFRANRSLVFDAAPTTTIREEMVDYISGISIDQIEKDKYLHELVKSQDNNLEKILTISTIIGKLKTVEKNGKKIKDNRTEMREELFANPEKYLHISESTIGSVRMGVLETVDSIYNFTGYVSTRASQDNQTESMDPDDTWGYDEAAFALGQWAREKMMSKGNVPIEDISSTQDVYLDPKLASPTYTTTDFSTFWVSFCEFQQNKKWVDSLMNYSAKLRLFESKVNGYNKEVLHNKNLEITPELIELEKRYKDSRDNHIKITNDNFLSAQNYKIVENDGIAYLVHFDDKKVLSKIQIEDFSKLSMRSRLDRSAIHAKEITKDMNVKGRIAEFDE